MYHTPKKQFGQNFLTSIPARNKIVEAGNPSKNDVILEIGPGKGFLTRALLDTGARVLALEKDRDLIPILSEMFRSEVESGQLMLLEGDVLTFIPEEHGLEQGRYKIIANIPYYITGAIFSRFLSDVASPSCMVVLIQKEVAERICAKDNKSSLLSLSVQAYCTPKHITRVSAGSFFPAPKVDSSVLGLYDISKKNFTNPYHEDIFFKLIHAAFAHKRKIALTYIQKAFPSVSMRQLFEELSIDQKTRAEDVTLSTWILLSLRLSTV